MSIAGKVKSVLSANGKDYSGLASALGISSQALSNKFYRDSFSTEDLIIVAEYVAVSWLFCPLVVLKSFWKERILSPKRLKESKPIKERGHKKSGELFLASRNYF